MFSSMLSLLGSIRGGSSFITNSLRFRSSASAYLSRTFTTPTNQAKWTWSGWVKRGTLGVQQRLFSSGTTASDTATTTVYFLSADTLAFSGGTTNFRISSQVFRDVSAWYHIVISIDTTQAVEANKILIYVNGNQITFSTTNPITTCAFNSAQTANIGQFNGANYFDGYLADINFIDGQALTPASFGAIDSSTGVWAPRPYSGTYGTNGFYLKFANTSSVAALGNDSSGNNNTWTVNNVSLTAGATYDSMIDVPVNYSDGGNGRGNYAVLSPLTLGTSCSLTNGNLTANWTSVSTRVNTQSNFGIPTSGKWYWEVNLAANTNGNATFGVVGAGYSPTAGDVGDPASGYALAPGLFGSTNMTKKNNNSTASWGAATTSFGAGITYGIAVDMDTGSIFFRDATGWMNASNSNDSTPITAAYTGLSGTYMPAVGHYSVSAQSTAFNINFGQRPFAYTPPAGFRALNTNNLPTPSIVNGANFMAATTYTGNAAARSLSNAVNSVSFQPDLVWIKSRTPGATNHALFDSVRGTTKYLSSNTTTGETTLAQSLTAFGADGFSLGTDTTLVNANANSYIAWQWRESITAGLDIVSYTGTGVARTVAHNLGVVPAMIIVKDISTAVNWVVYQSSQGASKFLRLNTTDAVTTDATIWNNTAPTSSVFSVGGVAGVNTNGNNYIAYCFAEIAGFSRFGSYTGNGLADGPFVFCGFRPRWVMVKAFSGANASTMWWQIYDTSRDTYNVVSSYIEPNSAKVETATSSPYLDVVSNGFKLRSANGYQNDAGYNYIFAAFAENPSKYALAR